MEKRIIVLFLLILMLLHFANGQRDYRFNKITTKDGLSLNSVHSVKQDSLGLIWIATRDGLNLYDGVEFKVFRNDQQNTRSLGSNDVNTIFVDSKGDIYIGVHQGGLNKFCRETQDFDVYKNKGDQTNCIAGNIVNHILESEDKNFLWLSTDNGLSRFDKKTKRFVNYPINQKHEHFDNWTNCTFKDSYGNFWIGTRKGGLLLFDLESKTIQRTYLPDSKNPYSINDISISCIYEDYSRRLWVGTIKGGLDEFDLHTDHFIHHTVDFNKVGTISDNTIFTINEDADSNLWVGTEHGGLNLYNSQTNTFKYFKNDDKNPFSLSQNSVYSIDKDNIGNLWISTYAGGINILRRTPSPFKHYHKIVGDSTSLSNNNILSTLVDSKNRMWVGTDGGGLNLSYDEGKTFKNYTFNSQDNTSLRSNVVLTIFEDSKGRIWIGTYGGGLSLYLEETDGFKSYMNNPKNKNSIGDDVIGSIMEHHDGGLWLGTWVNGLDFMDPEKEIFTHYVKDENDPNSLIGYHINCLYQDSRGYIWIGTHSGLSRFDPNRNTFFNFVSDKKDVFSISHNTVNSILEDSLGNFWIGTWGGGLNYLNIRTKRFDHYSKEEGLPNDIIYEIQKDYNGKLWLSTNLGLSCFDPLLKTFENFNESDGVLGVQFVYGSSFQTKEGKVFFGSTEGLNSFYPNDILVNSVSPEIVFTDFKLFNKPVAIGQKSILKRHISLMDTLVLNYRQSVFTLNFAALSFDQPKENNYAYKMEGFEEEFNYVGNQHSATYTNLDPGEYIFRVRASNNDNVWNEDGKSIMIIILPPFWMTWWFRILVTTIVILSIVIWYRRRINLIKQQKEELERLVTERTEEVVQQKEEIEVQKNQLEIKNDQITSSIHYAQTIQTAILPTEKELNGFQDHFVLYRQKDIVSGDFYWYSKVKVENKEFLFLAVVDCTGHGVPGAFMSMIGNRLLNFIVNEEHIIDPALILEQLDKEVVAALKQRTGVNKDGMDVGMVRVEYKGTNCEVLFAGAKRPLYIAKPDQNILVLKGDRKSIGGNLAEGKTFTTTIVQLRRNDLLYLSSDGFIDQNDVERKKFSTKKLIAHLEEHKSRPLKDQYLKLEEALDSHQKGTEQRDDITIIGVKL